ncbi:MAG: glutamate-cysteine ligase family protein [Hyphomonadaceae bacterium]
MHGRQTASSARRIADARDWEDHLTTIFPEVRLKTYLEMRGPTLAPGHVSARCLPSGPASITTTPHSKPHGRW